MDADFGEKLKNVLSDPEALAKISAIASSLGMNGDQKTPVIEQGPVQTAEPKSPEGMDIMSAFSGMNSLVSSDPRVTLLTSLKPLLREEKRGKIDALARALSIASMMKNFRK